MSRGAVPARRAAREWRATLSPVLCAVTCLAILGAAPARATPPTTGFAQAAARTMAEYTARDQFSGYVLVAHEGVPVFAQGFAFADRDARRVATGSTRFRIGSITKHFTATAVLLLAADGKVDFDAPVGRYYSHAPAAWDGITVRHLLEFRSGLFNMTYLPGFPGEAARDPSPEKLIGLVRDLPLESAPGTRFAYNNTDPVLLGYIVERASGTSYRDFVEQRVLRPAGLTQSGYEFSDVPAEERAVGYESQGGAWRPARLFASDLMYSAGAIQSTAEDLLRWDQLLYGEAPPARVLRAARRGLPETQPFHFGFFVEPFAGRPSEYAGGGQPGFASFVYRFPQDHVTIILLSNLQSAPVLKIGQALAREYFGVPPPPAPRSVPVDAKRLDRYAGTYELYPGVQLVLSRAGRDLQLRRVGGMPPPGPPETLVAIAPGIFLGEDCRIEFEADVAGAAPRLRYTIPRLKTERDAPRVR